MQGVIQHEAILALDRHPPRAHQLASHAAVPASDRGKYVKTDPVTGEVIFDIGSGPPIYAGDPVAPASGDIWYDSLNDRLRTKLAIGKGTITVMLDP